jgi:CRP/FNR family cyclic AMP-dependent transcriptional regulator
MTITTASRVSMQDGRQLLAQCSLFRRIAPDQRAALIGHAHIRKCAADETIFLMGSPGDSMMAVLSGNVRISVPSADGKEIVLAILGAGEIFGEVALLDGGERTADARAMTESSLAVLERRDVLSFFERHPSAWPSLVEMLCERLRSTDRQMAEVALLGLPVRLAKAMLRMAAVENPTNGCSVAHIRLSQRELGNVVGATRESVNKCLREWQRRGIIRIAESLITIVNRTALEDLAEFDAG